MGEDWGSWFPLQHIDWQSSNLNCSGSQLVFRKHYTAPTIVNPAADMISVKVTPSTQQPLEPLHLSVDLANEPHGWLCKLPRFQQDFAPPLNQVAPCDNSKEPISAKLESGCGQKKFLFFDQSGDQTTLIFGSGMKAPVGHFTSLCNLKTQGLETEENLNIHLGAITADPHAEDGGADLLSEMHEETDELNALLYSDDDSIFYEDDEVTSTGHSPSTMTVHNMQNGAEGGIEGMGSSDGSVKKRKLFEGCSDLPALVDTASSVKGTCSFEYENDAESRCDDMVSEPHNKKIRRDKIRETVNVLQNIIPCGKGKDAILVIDEAINYLKSLKLKAKALGLDAP